MRIFRKRRDCPTCRDTRWVRIDSIKTDEHWFEPCVTCTRPPATSRTTRKDSRQWGSGSLPYFPGDES